jgi:Flp pilus assembly protein TadD
MRRKNFNLLAERVSFRSGALLSLSALGLLSPMMIGGAGVAAFFAPSAAAFQGGQPDAATRAAMEKRANARALLSSALTRIAANGNNAAALADAGRASMALDDYRSALGFLLRAEQNAPRDGAIKAALGTAMLHQENPRRALDYFGEAQLLRTPERLFIADRALAYDLLGQQDAAQRDYALAMTQSRDDEIVRRYALSLGISGHTDRAIEILTPLLNQQDRSAWRMRAMILAMNSRQKEAKDIVDATMPPELASNIWPYLEQMDRLTPAQIAEAAHFGRFPSGPLGPKRQVAQMAVATPAPQPAATTSKGRNSKASRQSQRNSSPPVQVAEAAPAPQMPERATVLVQEPAPTPAARSARPLTGTAALNARQAEQARLLAQNSRAAAAAQPAAQPQAQPQAVVQTQPQPQLQPQTQVTRQTQTASRTQAVPTPASQISTVRDSTAAAASANAARSRVESIVAAQTVAPVPVSAAPATIVAPQHQQAAGAAPNQEKPLAAMASLGDIIGSLQIPAAELVRSDEAVSADTLVKLREERRRAEAAAAAERAAKARADAAKARADAAAKAKADAEAKAKAEAAAKKREEEAKRRANPARLWVQIGSGGNAGALQFTFDRYAKKHSAMFKGKKGATADWGRTRRLLVGPFNNRAAAQKFLDDFKKAEGDGFIFNSAVGEEVEPLK